MSFYSTGELQTLGLASFGEDVRISRKASIYNPGRISIGNHVRIDDFCVLSAGEGGIEIGDYVHIAVYCSLIGAGKIYLNDFCNLSSRVSIYSSNDDYTGKYLTNPTVPPEFTGVVHADVLLGKHVIIGSGGVVLPGICLADGAAVGALSLVTKDCQAFGVYGGVPARRIGERKRDLLELEKQLRHA
jgi:galactoside O-acetyltransferase